MDKVIQIANICKDMCNVPNPIPGRIYYPKGCAPALNTCGGGWRKPMFLWIRPKDISSGSPTTAGAISQTTTLSRCGRALSQDAPETD